jgi:polar amino acid transport system permease protein
VPTLTRRQKSNLTQATLYVVLVVALALVALLVDWQAVKAQFFNSEGLKHNWGELITTGVKNTAIYTVIAFSGGLVLAMALALMKLSPVVLYRWLATAYIEFFRGLPALIVMLAMAFGVPLALHWQAPGGSLGAGLIGLMMVAGAYMAETLRAGIQAVPKGQTEAARSLGMSGARTMVSITIPQAIRIVIPPLTNEFVLLIKDTSLLFIIGATASQRELVTVARDMQSTGFSAGTGTSLTMAAILYLIITLPLTRLVAYMEKKQQRAR